MIAPPGWVGVVTAGEERCLGVLLAPRVFVTGAGCDARGGALRLNLPSGQFFAESDGLAPGESYRVGVLRNPVTLPRFPSRPTERLTLPLDAFPLHCGDERCDSIVAAPPEDLEPSEPSRSRAHFKARVGLWGRSTSNAEDRGGPWVQAGTGDELVGVDAAAWGGDRIARLDSSRCWLAMVIAARGGEGPQGHEGRVPESSEYCGAHLDAGSFAVAHAELDGGEVVRGYCRGPCTNLEIVLWGDDPATPSWQSEYYNRTRSTERSQTVGEVETTAPFDARFAVEITVGSCGGRERCEVWLDAGRPGDGRRYLTVEPWGD